MPEETNLNGLYAFIVFAVLIGMLLGVGVLTLDKFAASPAVSGSNTTVGGAGYYNTSRAAYDYNDSATYGAPTNGISYFCDSNIGTLDNICVALNETSRITHPASGWVDNRGLILYYLPAFKGGFEDNLTPMPQTNNLTGEESMDCNTSFNADNGVNYTCEPIDQFSESEIELYFTTQTGNGCEDVIIDWSQDQNVSMYINMTNTSSTLTADEEVCYKSEFENKAYFLSDSPKCEICLNSTGDYILYAVNSSDGGEMWELNATGDLTGMFKSEWNATSQELRCYMGSSLANINEGVTVAEGTTWSSVFSIDGNVDGNNKGVMFIKDFAYQNGVGTDGECTKNAMFINSPFIYGNMNTTNAEDILDNFYPYTPTVVASWNTVLSGYGANTSFVVDLVGKGVNESVTADVPQYFTWEPNSTTVVTNSSTQDVLNDVINDSMLPIAADWLPLVITIFILAIILTMVIASFGRQQRY